MKVFIVGTASSFWKDTNKRNTFTFTQFQNACKNIGAWLSKKHHVIIAGTVEPTADHWIIEGVKQNFENQVEKGKPNITLYAALDDESHKQTDNKLLAWLNLHKCVFTSNRKRYGIAHQRALKECDIVLVIGGNQKEKGDNVFSICEQAMRSRKPVIGLSYYGTRQS